MEPEIKITKKEPRRGDDGYKIVSVRMKEEMLERLDRLAAQTNRSRNELINLLLDPPSGFRGGGLQSGRPTHPWQRLTPAGARLCISISFYSRLRMSSTSRFTLWMNSAASRLYAMASKPLRKPSTTPSVVPVKNMQYLPAARQAATMRVMAA